MITKIMKHTENFNRNLYFLFVIVKLLDSRITKLLQQITSICETLFQ